MSTAAMDRLLLLSLQFLQTENKTVTPQADADSTLCTPEIHRHCLWSRDHTGGILADQFVSCTKTLRGGELAHLPLPAPQRKRP